MSEEDQSYMSMIINLEISDLEVMRALSIYFDWRANGYPPDQAYDRGVETYMETGEMSTCAEIKASSEKVLDIMAARGLDLRRFRRITNG